MGADEEATLARLKAVRKSLVDPAIAAHRGRIVKTTGDGMLVEFASAVDAARAAVEVQRSMDGQNAAVPPDNRIEFRMGIHVGDIIIDDNDIFGDGVNIAARLEGIAEPGGVCISDDAQRQIRGKVDSVFVDMGPQNLKNITEPMRAWHLQIDKNSPSATPKRTSVEIAQPLALPDKPSIAVLPFQNMSGDPEQEYFADGMVEDIVTALSRFKSLFVIARNSSFTYRGRAVDVKQVGRELGVRYVLEGSVQKAGDRVRITGQLVDASTGVHIWADHFDDALEDIFDLQDRVAARVVGEIAPRLSLVEIERAHRKPTGNLEAYDWYLRAIGNYFPITKEASEEALRFLNKAIELDPAFASAYGIAAWYYVWRKINRWMTDPAQESAEAVRLARRAAELGKDDAFALTWAGYSLAAVVRELEDGAAFLDRALELNPNLAVAWGSSGWVRVWLGQAELAIEHLACAMRLSPLDPIMPGYQTAVAVAHFLTGHYSDASSWATRAGRMGPYFLRTALILVAASQALSGQNEEAQKAMTRLRQLDPGLRLSNLRGSTLQGPEYFARLKEGLRKAGLP